MPNFQKMVPFILCLAANAATAAHVEFVGDYSVNVSPPDGTVSVEIQELRNASQSEGTGELFLSLRHTQCEAPGSYGFSSFQVERAEDESEENARPNLYPLDRVVPGEDSSLAAQASWTGISFTTKYMPPPSGTYRRHLAVYELDYSESEEGELNLVGAATFPYNHLERGSEEYDSCFTALPLDANESHRGYTSPYDRGDYYRLRSYSRGILRVELSGNGETVGELLGSEGRPLDSDSVGSEPGTFRIERHVDDRVYYIRVVPASRDAGHYILRTALTPPADESERDGDDDTMQRATPLGLGVEVGAAIDEAGDMDWWRFRTRKSGRFVIETTGKADTYGRLLDAAGEVLAQDDDGGEGENFRIDDAADFAAGTYYVRVEGSRYGITGRYTLRVVHLPEDDSGKPDLVAELPDVVNEQLRPEEGFVWLARARNRGNGAADLSVLRFYRSANGVISYLDMREDSETVDPLGPLASSDHFVRFPGTAEAGHFYVGACVRPVEGESDADNNCTNGVRVDVRETPVDDAAGPVTRRYALPLMLSASDSRQGFARIINRSREPGTVLIHAVDDAGDRYGPVEVEMDAGETIHFNSGDLESGNPDKGMPGGIGAGEGHWRLELDTELDIAALAYVRTADGFLTSMHETAEPLDDGRYYIPFFNPASNKGQVSSLRLANPGPEDAEIIIAGIDDRGAPPPEGEVWLTLPAGGARAITAVELESGAEGLQGRFGSGTGKWRLFLSATAPIEAMSLLDSPTGNLTNLSARGRQKSLPLVLPVSRDAREAFVRIINRSNAAGSVRIQGIDDAGQPTDTVTLSLAAAAAVHLNSGDLQSGNESKGLAGGIGQGEGAWRLELQSDLDVEALAYVRTEDGFVTGVNDLAVDVDGIVDVPFFNPAINGNQESRLRLINPGGTDARVAVTGLDDIGIAPPYGLVRLTLPAGESRTITARDLEAGAGDLAGRFGDGVGKWRLSVASEQPIEVLSLLESSTGNLTNLSSAGGGAVGPAPEHGAGFTGD